MADLFTTRPAPPLAELLRPRTLDEVVGQAHLLGPGKPISLAFKAGKMHSFILWGPPGVGKTTLGRLAAQAANSEFIAISAVLAGVKEIRLALDTAQHNLDHRGRPTLLFVDEIHRFNKAQQDALLPHVESGQIVMGGATTENPGFEINTALLSRAQVYVLEPLSMPELRALYERALPHLGDTRVDEDALSLLSGFADGDGRKFLNLLEQVTTAARASGVSTVPLAFARSATSPSLRRFDQGDALYDQISALQKSIRGSSPDAALYWLARMLDGGADARYIARRLVVIASEDIGNADPRALELALNAAQAYERLGSPEGDRALAQAATYLAVAPKSNAVYSAWNEVRALVRTEASHPVPLHLRNAPTELAKQLGHKRGYRYAHAEPEGYAAGETYLPDEVACPAAGWYRPVPRGLEVKIGQKLEHLRALDKAADESGALD
jgi:putative ATPase